MQNKLIVFTGATSGIGEVSAVALAKQGARIALIARNEARGAATLAKLKQAGPSQHHKVYHADLSLIAETKRVGLEIAAQESQIDILINNAGALYIKRKVTSEGLEKTFALNHMSYFVLTEVLRDKLSPHARIVSTSSNAHQWGKLDFNDLQMERSYSGIRAYGNSKLCNILFTRELARRLAGTSITANCFHPGFVATNFGAESGSAAVSKLTKVFMALAAISPEKGAQTQIYLASSPKVEGVTGQYFYQCRQKKPKATAENDAGASRLWTESERLAGLPAS